MTGNKPDGGPAYPWVKPADYYGDNIARSYPGMSLRDYYAAKALVGLLSGPRGDTLTPDMASNIAFQIADAMLVEKAKP